MEDPAARERRLAAKRAWANARYANDPEHRAKQIAYSKQRYENDEIYREANRRSKRESAKRKYADPEWRAKHLAKLRERYATDEAYREAMKDQARRRQAERLADPAVRAAVNARNNARKRHLYGTDETFRMKQLAAIARWRTAKRQNDPLFRMISGIRGTVRQALMSKRVAHRQKTMLYIGCTATELAEHIEAQFQPGMSWANYGRGDGQWCVDHIRPIASFDISAPEQVAAAFHYTNLRPLWVEENRRKGCNWNGVRYKSNGWDIRSRRNNDHAAESRRNGEPQARRVRQVGKITQAAAEAQARRRASPAEAATEG